MLSIPRTWEPSHIGHLIVKLRIQSTPVWTALVQHLLVMPELPQSVGQTECDSAYALGGSAPYVPARGKGGSLIHLVTGNLFCFPTARHPRVRSRLLKTGR